MQEITLITGHSGVSAGKAGNEKLWNIRTKYLAFKLNNEYVLEEGQITYSGDDAMIKKLQHELPMLTTVTLIGEKVGHNITLHKVVQTGVEDPEADKLIVDFKVPVTINDEKIGQLTFNKSIEIFEGEIPYKKQKVNISIEHKDDLPLLHTIVDNLDDYVAKAASDAADELLENANDWQNDEDGEEVEITKSDFIDRITLESITIDESGYTIWFDDGDLFFGHIIYVSYDNDGNLLDATFAG